MWSTLIQKEVSGREPSFPFSVSFNILNNLDSQIVDIFSGMAGEIQLQAHLGDIVGSVPDYHNNTSITIKWVMTFLLVQGLAFHL